VTVKIESKMFSLVHQLDSESLSHFGGDISTTRSYNVINGNEM